jgi:hypothetical protein
MFSTLTTAVMFNIIGITTMITIDWLEHTINKESNPYIVIATSNLPLLQHYLNQLKYNYTVIYSSVVCTVTIIKE